ncbi:rRNA-processing protein EFG1 [Acropora cervicornis]|uniref:rRNA-processing protein EFG1 n=1 Tax=Acropora cervicornis TaxID=6130 RepID=A0AAD9PYJ0_ACRCE|nr:rRNA-processing protein EFG1 [Acropora cervicornis]
MAPRGGYAKRPYHLDSKVFKSDTKKPRQSTSLKKKLRDVQRLLKKPDLPATVRVEKERILQMLVESSNDKAKERAEKEIVKRCKIEKFFDKRKLFRKHKTCVRELRDCDNNDTRDSLLKKVEEIKLHWNYVVHFPLDTKYISLFPQTPYRDEEVRQKQERILKLTSVKVSSGELKDESTTISQFGRGSNESKPLQLRLREDDTQEKKPSGGSSPQKLTEDINPPAKSNKDNIEVFIDASKSSSRQEAITTDKDNTKMKKKKLSYKQ